MIQLISLATTAALILLSAAGCASLSGGREQYYVCSYETVWNAALDTMKGQSITASDKGAGLIETGWMDVAPLTERSFGIFTREGFGNRERARMSVAVKRMDDVAAVSVLETRQRWHARGGVTQQATKWWPAEPSQDTTNEFMDRINARLKEQGCLPT
ncbi:MAG: hypothetical protein CV090_07610 [Nitrospira sp. WS238]|nr:hypothetical protein [Nitrospira sp. WS238]